MGKCLSCCEDIDEPCTSQNGQALSATPTKTSVIHSSSGSALQGHVSVSTAPKQQSSQPLTAVLPNVLTDPSSNSSGEKKMFTPYPKLPPIKRPGSNEGKRTSFTSRDFSEARVQALFEKYKDLDDDCILADGIESLCNDLEVRPDEFKVLVLAWKFDAETMCRFTRSEFVNGCKKLHVDSIKGIQCRFPEMEEEVQNKQTFKELYRWTYKFGLEVDIGQRTLPTDMAISLWQLVFHHRPPPILSRWLDFLSEHPHVRGIPRDTWDMFLNFTDVVGNDLSSYDDTEAWPSLFDDFVEYENDRQNQNVKSDKPDKDFYDY